MKSRGNIILVVTFIIVGTVLFSAVGYLFYQNQKLSNKVSNSQIKTTATPAATTTAKATPNPQLSQSITPTPTPSKTKGPVVVFEAEDQYQPETSQEFKQELSIHMLNTIQMRLINQLFQLQFHLTLM